MGRRSRLRPYSLYAWKKKFAKNSSGEVEKDTEIRRLKKELARVSEERDILKKGRHWGAIDGVDGSRSRHRNVPHWVLSC
ncbi:Mobile element protein [Limimaricola hongkongensis DSM 17492]|uniref:Mobile element protein n=1 Tax=Limimaricola hongkongensis DSM 17492 TaxID=1122180 RepID=A0A017HAN6_9RHOB|nr:Mobile element protein [Limimaricola hongkongensis DSM 17492]